MDHPPLLVACLCAEWCGTCREYRPIFEAASHEAAADFRWVDIEDHDEVLGELDVENFPTLLVARGDEVLFCGTVLPHAGTLTRMLQSAAAGELRIAPAPETAGLPARVRALGRFD